MTKIIFKSMKNKQLPVSSNMVAVFKALCSTANPELLSKLLH
jgi:hypothetical protein